MSEYKMVHPSANTDPILCCWQHVEVGCIGLHWQVDPQTCTRETTAWVQSSTPTLAVAHLMHTVTCLCLLRVEWHVT